jgi:hypothetical protein
LLRIVAASASGGTQITAFCRRPAVDIGLVDQRTFPAFAALPAP